MAVVAPVASARLSTAMMVTPGILDERTNPEPDILRNLVDNGRHSFCTISSPVAQGFRLRVKLRRTTVALAKVVSPA